MYIYIFETPLIPTAPSFDKATDDRVPIPNICDSHFRELERIESRGIVSVVDGSDYCRVRKKTISSHRALPSRDRFTVRRGGSA